MKKRIDQILIKPVITEKTMDLHDNRNQVAFKVAPGASKIEIQKAVEEQYQVKVTGVNVVRYRGKIKRVGFHVGRRAHWKKAYVSLAEGQSIDFFQGV